MFLFREEYYLREPDPSDAAKRTAWRDKLNAVHNKAELIIAKNRHGATTTVQLRFDEDTTQFSNLDLMTRQCDMAVQSPMVTIESRTNAPDPAACIRGSGLEIR
jgi:DnaB-like helicase C terminal domain